MTSLQDEILSAFIDQNICELKDTEVSIALTRKGIACSPEEVRRQVQLLSPALFQLIFNGDKPATICVKPIVNNFFLFFLCLINSDILFRLGSVKIFVLLVVRL
jgi:hypothetical protein